MTSPDTPPPPPGWGQGPPPPSPPPPAQPLRNGLGVASLVLGIIGVLCGLVPLLFWASGILAVLALVFGCVGIGRARRGQADNKGVAIWGTSLGGVAAILAVVGLVITVTVVNDTVDELHGTGGKQESSAGKVSRSDALRFGEAFTYDDGVKVTVSRPASYQPGTYALGHAEGNKALTVKITVVNGSDESVDLDLTTVTFKDADGAEADQVYDGDLPRELAGHLESGKQAVATYAVSLPGDASRTLDVQVEPGFLHYKSATWSGTTP
ncbi:DUF4190 domain-containing protein [Streptomyces sp. Je 1-369]|uniref:DUF4190 domain-containing protein n=1 Tax=Streptomyces sp. Je 1-369 TaxID=2966192 RepID=UPI002286B7B8|nr:DUF4190 domain-containing protein [Streptomyces sp. Je 1-369]WAL95153.1 DUF4190 domain-containing protein [Streptomyces sp. Je 1-369]